MRQNVIYLFRLIKILISSDKILGHHVLISDTLAHVSLLRIRQLSVSIPTP